MAGRVTQKLNNNTQEGKGNASSVSPSTTAILSMSYSNVNNSTKVAAADKDALTEKPSFSLSLGL